MHELSIGENKSGAEQVIDSQPNSCGERPLSARQEEAGHADGSHVAGHSLKSMWRCHSTDISGHSATCNGRDICHGIDG
jgi:hypothetical protein